MESDVTVLISRAQALVQAEASVRAAGRRYGVAEAALRSLLKFDPTGDSPAWPSSLTLHRIVATARAVTDTAPASPDIEEQAA